MISFSINAFVDVPQAHLAYEAAKEEPVGAFGKQTCSWERTRSPRVSSCVRSC